MVEERYSPFQLIRVQRERQLTITSSRLDNLRAASYLKAAQLSRLGWHDDKTYRVSLTRVVSSTKPTSSMVIEVSATLVASTTCAQHQHCYKVSGTTAAPCALLQEALETLFVALLGVGHRAREAATPRHLQTNGATCSDATCGLL